MLSVYCITIMFVQAPRAFQIRFPPNSQHPLFFLLNHPPPYPWNPCSSVPLSISQVHVDCDLYSSTVQALGPIACRLEVGSVIAFDEFIGYVHTTS